MNSPLPPSTGTSVTALIADDEPMLRDVLRGHLARLWPALQVTEARNGVEALAAIERDKPTLCFLDIHMPGLTGIEVAQRIVGQAHVVFITAFDQYALEAFEHGAVDYLVKPVKQERLAATLTRLQERLRREEAPTATDALLRQLAERLAPVAAQTAAQTAAPSGPPAYTRWIKASIGDSVRLIPVEDIDYLKSDEKYTLVAWRGDGGAPSEALIRTPLKLLVEQLDPAQFQQVHRSVLVNMSAIKRVVSVDERATLHLKHRPEVLPVSRSFAQMFKAE